jgi:hypothetical protein
MSSEGKSALARFLHVTGSITSLAAGGLASF